MILDQVHLLHIDANGKRYGVFCRCTSINSKISSPSVTVDIPPRQRRKEFESPLTQEQNFFFIRSNEL